MSVWPPLVLIGLLCLSALLTAVREGSEAETHSAWYALAVVAAIVALTWWGGFFAALSWPVDAVAARENWPQLLFLALLATGLARTALRHGQLRPPFGFARSLPRVALMMGLLALGGFFDPLFA
ncbi:MAG: hypothetical protein AAF713_06945 [Pseudomonadota bacterium]